MAKINGKQHFDLKQKILAAVKRRRKGLPLTAKEKEYCSVFDMAKEKKLKEQESPKSEPLPDKLGTV